MLDVAEGKKQGSLGITYENIGHWDLSDGSTSGALVECLKVKS